MFSDDTTKKKLRATTAILEVLGRIQPLLPNWPAALPTPENPVVMPLEKDIDKKIMDRVVPPPGVSKDEAQRVISHALRFLTRSYVYLRATMVPGAMRHDIDGAPVSQVHPEHAARALTLLKQKSAQIPTNPQLTVTIAMQISAMKVSLPLQPDQLQPIADTVKTVDVTLDLGDSQPFTVPFSGKNYRRAMRQIQEMQAGGSDVVVLLQGRLVGGHRIEGAGLSVQARTPKS